MFLWGVRRFHTVFWGRWAQIVRKGSFSWLFMGLPDKCCRIYVSKITRGAQECRVPILPKQLAYVKQVSRCRNRGVLYCEKQAAALQQLDQLCTDDPEATQGAEDWGLILHTVCRKFGLTKAESNKFYRRMWAVPYFVEFILDHPCVFDSMFCFRSWHAFC